MVDVLELFVPCNLVLALFVVVEVAEDGDGAVGHPQYPVIPNFLDAHGFRRRHEEVEQKDRYGDSAVSLRNRDSHYCREAHSRQNGRQHSDSGVKQGCAKPCPYVWRDRRVVPCCVARNIVATHVLDQGSKRGGRLEESALVVTGFIGDKCRSDTGCWGVAPAVRFRRWLRARVVVLKAFVLGTRSCPRRQIALAVCKRLVCELVISCNVKCGNRTRLLHDGRQRCGNFCAGLPVRADGLSGYGRPQLVRTGDEATGRCKKASKQTHPLPGAHAANEKLILRRCNAVSTHGWKDVRREPDEAWRKSAVATGPGSPAMEERQPRK